ncbi:MAG: O-antigen ligase family protein [Verrucomicrobia bacterium]|nr:O-antigen ligase family protein [Verrucomicrobiota bacterium]MBU1734329.1 O-antigen ligase family protein [Verrucomicrobiota bacterium]MBU1857050.1 O-antigen ligase family protein [Verrucomicrobiota bacterium]
MTWPLLNYLANRWRALPPSARFAAASAVALLVWTFSSKALQDILVFGAFLFALTRAGLGTGAWKQPAGIAFIVVVLHLVLSLSFSEHPRLSLRDFSGFLEVLAGAFAIPVLFNTREKIAAALFYSAVAVALTLGYDLARLAYHLGPALLAKGHIFTPFILNHANVASMLAGAAIFVFFQRGLYVITKRNCCPASGVRLQSSPVRHPACGGINSALAPRSSLSVVGSGVCRPAFAEATVGRLLSVLGCLLGILICLAHMVIMASRGPQIAFALAMGGAGLLIPSRGGKLLWFLGVALAAGALIVNIEHVNPRFLEKRSMTNFSERVTVWAHTWDLARQRPWLGHGYGKRNFEVVYYSTHPPKSIFHYPHPHQFWLKLLFEFGWPGLILNLLAWIILALGLWRCVFAQPTFTDRLLPGTVGLMLCFIHLYGLGDYPDNIVLVAQFWLIPVALVLMKKTDDEHTT